jgi:hypothetical protein
LYTIEQVEKARGRQSALYLVKAGGRIVGQLEKYRNTRTERHPWKAYKGTGFERRFIGAYYPEDGGRAAAVAAVTNDLNP